MLSQPKSAVHQQSAKLFNNTGGTSNSNGIMTSNSSFENADRLLEQKRTGSQFHFIQ
jgi:hypothetical protein